jgi:hypothetical protein
MVFLHENCFPERISRPALLWLYLRQDFLFKSFFIDYVLTTSRSFSSFLKEKNVYPLYVN